MFILIIVGVVIWVDVLWGRGVCGLIGRLGRFFEIWVGLLSVVWGNCF